MNVQGQPLSLAKNDLGHGGPIQRKPESPQQATLDVKADVFTVIRHNRLVCALAFLTALAFVFISEGSYWQSVDTLDDLGAMAKARTSIRALQEGLLNAETGQRGYLLTRRKSYLEPYDEGIKDINDSLQFLSLYAIGKPALAQAVHEVKALTSAKLTEMATTLKLQDEGNAAAALELVMSGIGSADMSSIRIIGEKLLAIEQVDVMESRADIYRTLLLSRSAMAVLSALSLLALYLYLRQTYMLKQQQFVLQRSLQQERDRLELEVFERTAELTKLTHYLQTAREDERSRLARNLHDDLGALLTSAKLDAARIKSRVTEKAPEALELLAHLVTTLNSGIALGRSIIEDLRPSALSNLGLVPTLEILAREFSDHTGLPVHCTFAQVRLEPAAELMVYRLVQEAMTNITKYAKAKQVWVKLGSTLGQVEVSVQDDGVGFDTGAKTNSAYGLMGMRFRVEAEGGVLTLTSWLGAGTLIQAHLPETAATSSISAFEA